jgi:hypothetical protein
VGCRWQGAEVMAQWAALVSDMTSLLREARPSPPFAPISSVEAFDGRYVHAVLGGLALESESGPQVEVYPNGTVAGLAARLVGLVTREGGEAGSEDLEAAAAIAMGLGGPRGEGPGREEAEEPLAADVA